MIFLSTGFLSWPWLTTGSAALRWSWPGPKRAGYGGGTARIILGIDEGGASIEGLRSAISDFDQATILHDTSGTFHPKLYIVSCKTASVIVVGSGNMTRGGLFENYEAGVCLDLVSRVLNTLAGIHRGFILSARACCLVTGPGRCR